MADALEDKLNAVDRAGGKPWMKHVGNHRETQRINSIIDGEFEEIDPEMWR